MTRAPRAFPRVVLWLAIAPGLAGACSSDESIHPTVEATWVSGSRLTMMFDDGGDGALAFAGILDTSTGEPCALAVASDGVLRCLPLGYAQVGYADAACTAPVIIGASAQPCDLSAFAITEDAAQGCTDGGLTHGARHVFEADGSPPVTDATTYYLLAGRTCVAIETSGYADVLRPAREVDPTTLVAAVTHTEPGGDDLGLVLASGEDGSQSLFGLVDTARDRSCVAADHVVSFAPFSVTGCVPQPLEITYRFLFAGAGCSERVVPTPDGCEPAALVAVYGQGCEAEYSLFAPGARGETATVYDGQEICVAETATEAFGVYGLGAPMASSSLPQFGSRSVGTGRLRARYRTAMNGRQLEPQGFVDLDLGGAPCGAQTFADGTVRCAPAARFLWFSDETQLYPGFFLDPACERAAVRIDFTGACSAPAPSFAAVYERSLCGTSPIAELRTLGAPAIPTELYMLDAASGCVPAEFPPDERWSEIGPVVDPGTLVELVRVK
jgi:hypothetical protein